MSIYKEQIHEYVQNHRKEIVEELKELLAIPSVRGEALIGAPFGQGPAAALRYSKQLYEKYGFGTELDAEGGYLLSYYRKDGLGDAKGQTEKSIGLFAHVDTVDPGKDWIYTEPFIPLEKDGFLIGRGALDNKAAVILSLYCARLLRELSFPFSSRLVMFTGSNEETGMQDIENYAAGHTPPDFSLVCDTAFPFYRGNKGSMNIRVSSNKALREIRDFSGGETANVTLGRVQVRLDFDEELYAALKSRATERIKVSVETQESAKEQEHMENRSSAERREIVILAEGVSCHGALPEGSLNAGYLAARFLAECELICESDRMVLAYAAELLKNYYGESLDIENEDLEFGRLTCTNGIIRMAEGKLELTFNIRFGKAISAETIRETCRTRLAENGWDILQVEKECIPWIIDRDNAFVRSLLEVYREFTGEENAQPLVNAGGTYARCLPCAVETGPQVWKKIPFPMPLGHGGAHQPDECISVDGLLEAIELTTEMLLECDRVLQNV